MMQTWHYDSGTKPFCFIGIYVLEYICESPKHAHKVISIDLCGNYPQWISHGVVQAVHNFCAKVTTGKYQNFQLTS